MGEMSDGYADLFIDWRARAERAEAELVIVNAEVDRLRSALADAIAKRVLGL